MKWIHINWKGCLKAVWRGGITFQCDGSTWQWKYGKEENNE